MLLRSTLAPPPRRQAVILLIVVILLSLFLVVGLSFVLYAESEATASRIYREAFTINYDRADVPADELLKWALGQLVYDVADVGDGVYSAMRGNSLGRSAFGWNDPVVAGSTTNSNTVAFNGIGRVDSAFMSLPPELAGQRASTLINHTYFQNSGYIRDPERTGFRSGGGNPLNLPFTPINRTTQPFAGGWNVPYTYPDRNNVFLAALKANDPAPTGSPRVMAQSFHRPLGTPFQVPSPNPLTLSNPAPWLDTTNAALKYQVLRPRPVDMYWGGPNDPHSFPLPASDTGDVQNLPGGVGYDSFWMDLGYPVQATRGGRKFKPLFAFLVVDLDGRVNVNVHGNNRLYDISNPGNPAHASNQGWGKWEVNLAKVLNANPAELQGLFTGSTATAGAIGRYGQPIGSSQPGNGVPYPDLVAGTRRSYLAPVDTDSADDSPTPQMTQKFNLPTAFLTFPTFTTGYDGLVSNQSRINHPGLYNVLNAGRDSGAQVDRPLLMAENLYYLIGNATGPNHERSVLWNLGLRQNLALPRIRHMLTTHSYDLDTPGAMPWVTDPTQAPYQLQDQQNVFFPTAQGGFTLNQNPSAMPAVNGTDFIPGDGRCRIFSRLDMNRKLTPYPVDLNQYTSLNNGALPPPTGGTPPDPSTQPFYRAVWERQKFAQDIYARFAQATGANLAAAAGSPEHNALRYLAQLSVNIVDYIDDDEYSTPFYWDPTQTTEVVYGVESPKVVLNEVYAEIRNAPGDDNPTTGAQQPYRVHFWVEMFNTHKAAQLPPAPGNPDPNINPLINPPTGANRATAQLKANDAAGNWPVYRIQVHEQQAGFTPQDMRAQNNTDGKPGPNLILKCKTNDWEQYASGFNPTVDAKLIQPNDTTMSGPQGQNIGFYVVGSDNDIEGATPTITPTNRLASSGQDGLSYTVPAAQNVPKPTHALLLQKLLFPMLKPNPDPQTGAVDPQRPVNPYVTVDYVANVPTNDAVKVEPLMAPGVPADHAGYQQFATRRDIGRTQPFAATTQTAAQTPPHSFFNHNAQSPQFDWLVHLDRPPVSPMELLHVTPYKPHELTQMFQGRTQPQSHTAPWTNDQTRLYRALEYFTVGDRGNWTYMSPTPIPGYQTAQPSTMGRTAGRINLNTVWDREVFDALVDFQFQSNHFTPQDLNQAWDAIQQRRSSTLGGSNGTTDEPYIGFATPASQNGVLSAKQTGHGGTPLRNTEFGYGTTATQSEYLKREMLTKIANNFGVRSNVFAVYLTVGFFEVVDDTVRPVKLGAEIRTRSGIPIRHKMFSIVDRTQMAIDDASSGLDAMAPFRQAGDTASPPTPPFAGGLPPRGQFFLTSEDGVANEELGTTKALRIVGGVPNPITNALVYDGQALPLYTPGLAAGTFRMYADVGVNQEVVVCAVTGDGRIQVMSPFTRLHAAGFPLSLFRPGNPGPQGSINYNDQRYKQVIPYAKVIQ